MTVKLKWIVYYFDEFRGKKAHYCKEIFLSLDPITKLKWVCIGLPI